MEEYKNKGLTGLANLGNTCFLNSTMQCISNSFEINKLLDGESYKKKINKKFDSVILLEWDKLRKMMWKENCTISPGGFVSAVQKVARLKKRDIFTGWAQNDLPEFLMFIIDCFHNSLNRQVVMNIKGTPKDKKDKLAVKCYSMIKEMYSKDFSEFLDIFYGIHVSSIASKSGKVYSETPESFFMISLPIPDDNNQPTLLDCFDLYTTAEMLEGENQYSKDNGEKVDAEKSIKFWNFPNVLVIDLKRFNNTGRKNNKLIDFPTENLDLSKYLVGYNKKYIYDLYGICNHSGNSQGGHYTAYVKNLNGKWYHYNDTNVDEIDEQSLVSNKAYCFFYKKRDL